MKHYDCITVGAGVGGLTATTSLNGAGLKCAIVEEDKPGGERTYYGCVPTKTILSITEALARIKEYKDLFSPKDQQILDNLIPDYRKVTEYKRSVVDRFSQKESWQQFIDAGIDVYKGHGRFVSDHEIAVGEEILSSKYIILATGGKPVPAPIPGLVEAGYLTHVEALELTEPPRSIAIIGAGAIGIEFAQFFIRMGIETTVIQRSDHILSNEDPEMADLVEDYLRSEGVNFFKETTIRQIRSVYSDKKAFRLVNKTGEEIEILSEAILCATGMKACTDDLGLEKLGIEFGPKGTIVVDDFMQTKVGHIYACGDVTGKFFFTHYAEHQANIIAHNIQNPAAKLASHDRVVPWATFTDPPIARVGLIESAARERYGENLLVARLDFSQVERARMMRAEKGRVKILVNKEDNTIVGATVVGAWADAIIHECVLAMQFELDVTDIFKTMHIYPTLSEAIKLTLGKIL